MKKILTLLFVFALAISVCGCGILTTEQGPSATPTELAMPTELATPTIPTELPTPTNTPSGNSKITEEEAIEIASQYWGIKTGDIDELTGFEFLIMPVDSSNDNIKIALKWLVENYNYSTVDFVEIDPYTGEIIGGNLEE